MIRNSLMTGVFTTIFASAAGIAGGHLTGVEASDQDVSGGTVTASNVMTEANGWLVVHRTDDSMKPGPVIGHAPLRKGDNINTSAILTETVNKGQKLMLMLHSEAGGTKTGVFEYTLGAKEDGPVKREGNLVMAVITAL